MSTALGLAMQISANTAQLAASVREVNQRLDSISDAGQKTAKSLGVLQNIEIGKIALSGVSALGGALKSLGSTVYSVTQDFISFGKSVADELDRLNDISQRTGVSAEALQAYGAAAKLAGIESEAFAKALQKLTVNIGKAAGDEKAQKAFSDLGIAFDELRSKSPSEQFEMIADALAKISDPAERAAAAVKLFGKGGIELGPLFSEGPGAMKAIREEAEKLGWVIKDDGIKAIAAMNDAIDKVFMTFKAIVGQIVSKLAPLIEELANRLLGVVQSMGGENIADMVVSVLLDAIDVVAQALVRFAQFLDQMVRTIGPLIGIDFRTTVQKAIDAIEAKISINAWTGDSLTPQELEELKRLRLQAEKEAAEAAARQSYEQIIDTIKRATQAARDRMGRSDGKDGTPTTDEFDYEKIVRELKELNRNSKYATVEIMGGR